MKNNIIRLHNYLKGLTPVKFIITILIMEVLFNLLMGPIYIIYIKSIGAVGGPLENSTLDFGMFLTGVTIVPLIETLIFQLGTIRVLQIFFKVKNKKVLMLISAVAFILEHRYSPIYMLFMIFPGIIYAYTFIIYDDKKYHPYLIVATIHALSNLITLSFNLI
ncbi:hypothetical protein J2Z44_001858 [Clostridium punense]|uniref:CAAX prenyl protease 2/Lysostaphin resistance protein A-like domain-containing protein n=1 Tax=Clostridium punense TaxID=1054297 RepID=A0ABS4K2P1_9CLOT|nr:MULTISPECIES: CPBP family glutamic-type intramembrane protease [Clostridium]EQB87657.1 hypothetical protein M918_08160 [Clostridium sp. BL8]MBP2022057.1 hypothetical protein [Clostridium punense]